MMEYLKHLKAKLEIEHDKALAEASSNPFEVETLNRDHHLLWRGHANAYKETIQEINRMLEIGKLTSPNLECR